MPSFEPFFQVMAQAMTNQDNREVTAHVNPSVGTVATRIKDFTMMNPLEFHGSKVDEDPQEFIDEMYKIVSVLYHPGKLNVVVDTLSKQSMGSVAYVEDGKKELVRDVHRFTQLGVCLVDFNEGGVIVQNGLKSSLLSDVKAK
ncbi:hypothetical protein MTR67_007626 [Solanum verrucosum]|uniref:Gag-pol polyprotein n=1 Tax=Solanum verrucosum TaxID=315347 RepID=A0AAF0TCX0_SOLVR|nr:hypothetical protein MTR67_007626 [Solanum verrucosum]